MHECRGTGHRAPTEGLNDCRVGIAHRLGYEQIGTVDIFSSC
jgi:hypothetical protein